MRLPVTSVSLDTRKLASFALVAFMVGGLLGGIFWNFGGVYVPTLDTFQGFGFMKQFESQDQLIEFLEEYGGSNNYYKGGPVLMFGVVPSSVTGRGFAVEELYSDLSQALDPDYSSTNIQVEGVDEADIVKTDGEYIYLVKSKSIYIIKAYPAEEAQIVTKLELEFPVHDIYVNGDKLVAFSFLSPYYYMETFIDVETDKEKTQVSVYDISDRANPVLDQDLTIDGMYFNSRMIGDYVYFIITNPAYMDDDTLILPTIRQGKEWCTVEAEDIWYPNVTQGWISYHTITALNIMDPDAKITSETFLLDDSTTLYVSPRNMYIVSQGWRSDTVITKIGIEDGGITFRGNGTVPGYILNQFSMDEYKGVFRVATTSRDWRIGTSGNNVYTLNEDMEIIGSLENLAPGEDIYSARFMGDRCYLVTFKKVDPLFTIDLSDPENPTVLGKLKIPGYSDYLHPYDENTLIGVGKETVEAKEGDFSWYQGVKISLFDVSDVENPRELAKIEIGDRGTDSPALRDHHAFLFSKERNLLVIPILEAQIDEDDFSGDVPGGFYGDYVYQGAYVFDISLEGIELRGQVTHIDDDSLLRSGFWFESENSVERSLYIEENLYTISQGKLKINNLETLEEVASINLGE
ncbi:MAG: beta-propeller domain-containing protein [Candidatus Bathyarchaeota archaeon]|nr:beta-propeller domain-containing protein [Candidatus Bathyarchaeota archaeon]